jgi:hypothetical protein
LSAKARMELVTEKPPDELAVAVEQFVDGSVFRAR